MKNKNTYSLLTQSDEKGRSIFEGAVYGLVVLSIAFTSFQFATGSVTLPGMNRASDKAATGIAVEVMEPAPAPIIASR